MVPTDFLDEQRSQLLNRDPLRVEGHRHAMRLEAGLLLFLSDLLEIWVLERLQNRDPLRWVEVEHVVEEVHTLWRRGLVDRL